MSNQISRIFQHKVKVCLAAILILTPSMEIFQHLWYAYRYGLDLPVGMYATFLSTSTLGHMLQSLLLWFLPLYLLVITGVDSVEDYHTGYKQILITKVGKKKYVKNKLVFSFVVSFAILFLGLLLNFAACLIVFRNGTHVGFDVADMSTILLFRVSYAHPIIANLLFILTMSFLAGLISTVGTALSIVFHNKKIVFALSFALWFGAILPKTSLMLVTQPFAEYDFDTTVPIFLWVVGLYLIVIAASYLWEVRLAKI